jgi:WS/DGAT/MGAT family acyltransferase
MDEMSPLDAAFLDAEDEDRHTSMAIASIAVFEGPAPTYDEFVAAIAGRLPLVPRYRQKVRQLPLDLGRPVWVDDPDFDVRFHIRQTAVAPPGGDVELRQLMARVMTQRLDRDRPLWEYWFVRGLSDERWALISKLHHCMVDGVSGTDLFRAVLDSSPEPRSAVEDDWQPTAEPPTWRLTAGAVRELALEPIEQARALGGALRSPRAFAQRAVDTVVGLGAMAGALRPASASSLSGPIGQQRRYGWARATMPDVMLVRRHLGGTVNDVVLAAISGGFRALLLSRGETPDARALRSMVPVSVRAPGEEGIYENRVSTLFASLPVHIADPVERLDALRSQLVTLKASKEAEAGAAMTSLASYEPFPLVSLGMRLAFRLPQRNITTVTTNVPGPRQPLYACGRRTLEVIPYVPIATTVRVGIAIMSYCDTLAFGITADYDSTPDIDILVSGIQDSLGELVAVAKAVPESDAAG